MGLNLPPRHSVEPFLRWAGGKRWLARKHREWFQSTRGTYIEPFLGGGAVFFDILPKRALLSDLNRELIMTYQSIRDEPERVVQHLSQHAQNHSSKYYYHVRDKRLRAPHAIAARLIYLNRTCFNGLYRVNRKGEFNVPKGSQHPVLLESDNFIQVAKALASATLRAGDFEATIDRARRGDLVYADPPYTVKHNQNSFVDYNEHIFSWSDQERLAESLHAAAERGVRVVLSNADHPSIHELFTDSSWEHLTIPRFSGIGSSANYRRMTTEAVISNFLARDGSLRDQKR